MRSTWDAPAGLQVVARVGEVEASVGQREVGHDRVGQRDGQGGPVEKLGSTFLTRVRGPSAASSTRWVMVPRQPSTIPPRGHPSGVRRPVLRRGGRVRPFSASTSGGDQRQGVGDLFRADQEPRRHVPVGAAMAGGERCLVAARTRASRSGSRRRGADSGLQILQQLDLPGQHPGQDLARDR